MLSVQDALYRTHRALVVPNGNETGTYVPTAFCQKNIQSRLYRTGFSPREAVLLSGQCVPKMILDSCAMRQVGLRLASSPINLGRGITRFPCSGAESHSAPLRS